MGPEGEQFDGPDHWTLAQESLGTEKGCPVIESLHKAV